MAKRAYKFKKLVFLIVLCNCLVAWCLSVVLKPQPSFPGDNGRAVVIPKDREAESKELFKINQFNLVASDMMSLNRTLPDYRMDAYALLFV